MDPYADHFNKHLEKFHNFASNFTKAFVPIVDTAIKMSTGVEPVSAFGVFQTAKTVSDGKKKSKKNHNAQSGNKGKDNQVKKEAMKPSGKKHNTSLEDRTKSSMVGKGKSAATAKPISAANQKNKAANVSVTKKAATKNKPGKIKDSEVVNLVEQLMGDPAKKLSKAEQKKKQDLENYLVKQLEKDEGAGSNEEGEDFESEDEDGSVEEGSEEDYSDSDSDEFSAEYTINESGSYTYELTGEDEGSENTDDAKSSTNEDDALVQDTTNKANRKRKSPEPAKSQAKSAAITTNGISEAKKSKKPQEQKAMTRKSLPATKVEKAKPEDPKRRKSLATSEVKGKGSTPNASVTTVNVKLEPLSPPHNVSKVSSIDEGKRSFKWLLNPVTVDDFFGKYWEAKACLIKRKQANYFSHLMSFEMIDQMLIKNHVEFTKNLDVTSYKNGVRETLNPEGRAMPPVVWDHYGQGCSIRLLNPQTFLPQLYTLNTTMQEYFHCLVGANAYLTPPNSQGFAPHYDDIEAFVMQIEGRKRWKLYKPRMPADILPRDSSHNFTQQEIGKPILDEVLEPGDVLYFPRGTIHQACTEPGYHSLHITLSVYQRQSYADLFEKMLPLMLKKAIATNVDMRRGLPLNTWSHAGIAFSDNSTKERADLQKKVTQLMHKCIKDMPLKDIMDAAVDQVAKKFQHEALPPEILPSEKLRTVFGSRNRTNERGECVCDYDIDERTNVRLLRANIMRLVDEEEKIRIYYYLDNSKEYCEYDPNFIEIEAMEAASVEVLIKSYPAYVGVSQLPLPSYEQKLNLVTALWERGLLMMEKPFK